MARSKNLFNDYVVALTPENTVLDVWTGSRYKNYDPAQHITQYCIACANSGHDAIQRALEIQQQFATA